MTIKEATKAKFMPKPIPIPSRASRDDDSDQHGICFFCEAAWAALCEHWPISPCEAKIVQCLLRRNGEADAARLLEMAPATVHKHLERLHKKLGVGTRADLISLLCYEHIRWRLQANPPLGCQLIG